jgi:hypothetical protein
VNPDLFKLLEVMVYLIGGTVAIAVVAGLLLKWFGPHK